MKDIKELIFAAVEENAVKFQEMANELLHARAYEAIEALRPEAAASMFGEEKESKKKGNESCDDMDDEDDSGEMDEEVDIQEVAPPKTAADWQALITHQIKTTGHPVATDAQFRAQHGKDTTKIASQEPGEDKMNYAKAQGGEVKQ